MNIDVLYKLICNKYEQKYIGQTKLNVSKHMKKHKDGFGNSDTSRAADHVLANNIILLILINQK